MCSSRLTGCCHDRGCSASHSWEYCRRLLWTHLKCKLSLVREWFAVSVVADGDDKVGSRYQLAFHHLTRRKLRGVVGHSGHLTAVVLISRVLVDQHKACQVIVAAFKFRHEGEAGVRVGIDKVGAAALEIHAKG